jgi:hypothetical protein
VKPVKAMVRFTRHITPLDSERIYKKQLRKLTGNDKYETLACTSAMTLGKKHLPDSSVLNYCNC